MQTERHAALQAYAGWNPNLSESRTCASGGTAWLLAKHFIEDLNGVVYATGFTLAKTVSVIRAASLQDLEQTKGSRYVRSSFPANLHDQLKQDLQTRLPVLFIGTPCQVAAVRSRWERFRNESGMTGGESGMTGNEDDSLLCADLLCHGAPPQTYLDAEIRHLIGNRPYTDVRFRGNDEHDYHLSIWDKESCIYSVKARKQPYLLAMLRGVTLMDGCYQCPFASPQRTGDITLGDYIGLDPSVRTKAGGHNISYISINTEKGRRVYETFLRAQPAFRSVERPLGERLSVRSSILEPAGRSPLRDKFLQRLPRLGFARAVRRTMRMEILKESAFYRTLHHWAHLVRKALRGGSNR